MINSLYKKFLLISLILALLANCVHKGSVEAVRPTNIYSDSDKKIQGNFVYVVDKTSLSKLKRDDTVQGFLCGAHNYPVDGTEAFNSSLPHMLEQVFEKITKNYLKDKLGMIITKNESPNHDIVANNVKIEVKGSSFWSDGKGGGSKFRWQQIRLAQDYDVIIFLAMYPDTIKFYYATKQDLLDNINLPKYNQHGGKKVDSGTKCIDGFPEDFPWMKEIVDGSFISKQ